MIFNKEQIKEIIPHREPFLLVDEITEYEEGVRAVGMKRVTGEEYFFEGHFPENPIMPGVLVLEACAQVGAVLALSKEEFKGKTPLFTGADNVKWKTMVKPGDVLVMECEIVRIKFGTGIANITATVDGKLACKGEIKFLAL